MGFGVILVIAGHGIVDIKYAKCPLPNHVLSKDICVSKEANAIGSEQFQF